MILYEKTIIRKPGRDLIKKAGRQENYYNAKG
jgi:hypothetical protein